jgi:hypothetical protein
MAVSSSAKISSVEKKVIISLSQARARSSSRLRARCCMRWRHKLCACSTRHSVGKLTLSPEVDKGVLFAECCRRGVEYTRHEIELLILAKCPRAALNSSLRREDVAGLLEGRQPALLARG